jgi:hypothetical protein
MIDWVIQFANTSAALARLAVAVVLLGAGLAAGNPADANPLGCRQSCIALNVPWAKACNTSSARDTSGGTNQGAPVVTAFPTALPT